MKLLDFVLMDEMNGIVAGSGRQTDLSVAV